MQRDIDLMLTYWGKKVSLKWLLTTLSIQVNIDIKTLTTLFAVEIC